MPVRPSLMCLGLLVGGLLAPGCSGKKQVPWGTVSGRVSLAGKPVTEGSVVFANPELSVARMAELQPDGTFTLKSVDYPGLPVGAYRVTVGPQVLSKGDFVPVGRPQSQQATSRIPEKYGKVDTSGLTAEVKAGRNPPFEFTLEP